MKLNLRSYFILITFMLLNTGVFSQDIVNITVTVTSVAHNFQCCDDAAGVSCGFLPNRPEPRYRITGGYQLGGGGYTNSGVTVVNLGDGVSCGTYTRSDVVMSQVGVCADEVRIDVDMWEEDGCGSDNTFDNTCTNDDENRTVTNASSLIPSTGTSGNFMLTVTGGGGYSLTARVDWVRVASPSVTPSSATVCPGGSVSLSATTGQTVAGANFLWYDAPTGGTLLSTGANYNPTLTSTTTYYVAYGGISSCTTDRTAVPITVSTAPAPTAAGTTICQNTTATLTASAAGAIGFNWYSDAGLTTLEGTGSSFTTPSLVSNTSYYVTATYGSCVSAATQVDVVVNAESTSPSGATASPSTPICPGGGPVNLAVIGGTLGAGANWVWYAGGCASGTSIGSGPSLSVNPSVTTVYYVRAEGTCNNTSCASVTVTVETLPSDPTAINASSTAICTGETVLLSVSGGSPGSGNWVWYESACGTGTMLGTGSTISVSPSANTDYFVRAETACGNTACASVSITVNPVIAAPTGASASLNNICPGDTTVLSVTGATLPADYAWVWYTAACGAVPVGVGQTFEVAPNSTTTYYVAAVGICGTTSCQSVTVTVQNGSVSPSSISTDNNNFCMGGSANLSVVGGSLVSGAVWTWYENACGGGTAIGTGNTIAVTPGSSTTYYVRGEGGSCGNTQCAMININVNGSAVYLVPFDTVCVSGNTSFNLTGGLPTGGTYSGAYVSGGSFNATSAGPGSHPVTYSYTDGSGCTGTATENIVVVDANSAPSSISASSSVVCDNGSSTLTVVGGSLVSGANWFWYENACGGGTSIGSGNSIVVNPTQTTTYFVRAEGGNAYCGPSSCAAVTVSVSNPSANLLPFEDMCGLNAVTLTQGFPDGGAYAGPGVTGDVFDASVAGVGVHTITYTYTDGNGCSAMASGEITVSSGSLSVEATVIKESCANGGIQIAAAASGGNGAYLYSWSDGSYENPHLWTDPGMYSVTVTDGSGCSATLDSIEVVDELACLELPNTFTPNGDGKNDTWNLDFTSYSSAKLEVYSKWGSLVYQTDGLTINWNGNDLNGNQLPVGTYYYIIELDQGTMSQNGPISIVR